MVRDFSLYNQRGCSYKGALPGRFSGTFGVDFAFTSLPQKVYKPKTINPKNSKVMFKKDRKKVEVSGTIDVTTSTPATPGHKAFEEVKPKNIGKLDMVIAFDTTGSMAHYIGAVRKEVASLIPELFADNEDLRLGIVAFGDYCDMPNPQEFGIAYQSIAPTNNENELIRFVNESKNTGGGNGDEFYELVLKKIVEETPWREDATKAILLIADACPHPLGYTYENCVVGNEIDWRVEAQKAANKKIKIDTVTITNAAWYRELSAMTNGVSIPFHSGEKTVELVRATANARGSMKSRAKFDACMDACRFDDEMFNAYKVLKEERNKFKD